MTMANQHEVRHEEDVQRQYSSDAIRVNWEPRYCVHAMNCWRSLPDVFRPRESPWVRPAAASADEIAWVVAACPSGALSFERLDGGPPEPVPGTTTVGPQADGPLYVRGNLRFVDAHGNVIREASRAALCRCGHSSNKPFCDLSHLQVGFKAQ
jgi:uncharacterized Fe-S cluster protein YjdI